MATATKVDEKYKGNIAAAAWDATRDPSDPTYDAIPDPGFKENLNYRAEKVRETGIALTNFEKKVASLLASDEGKADSPMAVVSPPAGVDYEAAAEGLVEKSADKKAEIAKVDAADAKAEDAADAAAKKQAEADKAKQTAATKATADAEAKKQADVKK